MLFRTALVLLALLEGSSALTMEMSTSSFATPTYRPSIFASPSTSYAPKYSGLLADPDTVFGPPHFHHSKILDQVAGAPTSTNVMSAGQTIGSGFFTYTVPAPEATAPAAPTPMRPLNYASASTSQPAQQFSPSLTNPDTIFGPGFHHAKILGQVAGAPTTTNVMDNSWGGSGRAYFTLPARVGDTTPTPTPLRPFNYASPSTATPLQQFSPSLTNPDTIFGPGFHHSKILGQVAGAPTTTNVMDNNWGGSGMAYFTLPARVGDATPTPTPLRPTVYASPSTAMPAQQYSPNLSNPDTLFGPGFHHAKILGQVAGAPTSKQVMASGSEGTGVLQALAGAPPSGVPTPTNMVQSIFASPSTNANAPITSPMMVNPDTVFGLPHFHHARPGGSGPSMWRMPAPAASVVVDPAVPEEPLPEPQMAPAPLASAPEGMPMPPPPVPEEQAAMFYAEKKN